MAPWYSEFSIHGTTDITDITGGTFRLANRSRELSASDTICIGKLSNAEISEAINSMFNRYALSTICYAYLADHEVGSFVGRLPNSQHFTRRWTLQELIASGRVESFALDWSNIGTRQELSLDISQITKIDADKLSRESPVFGTYYGEDVLEYNLNQLRNALGRKSVARKCLGRPIERQTVRKTWPTAFWVSLKSL